MADLVIRGGTVVDGTGARGRTADVAIEDGWIVEVGDCGPGRREIDADGALVTPGWVDIHTHYDGQVSWDPLLTPSSQHGVTTVISGNCGVGFAPVKAGGQDFLIELMESIEDIPGTALHEGIDWRWETFGDYLDALEDKPLAVDYGSQVAHAPVRAYVLGDRAHDPDITTDEATQMADVVRDGVAAGAFGFSTSRTILHRSRHGLMPGTVSGADELRIIAEGVAKGGSHGRFQYVSDDLGQGGDEAWLPGVLDAGVPVTYTLAQSPFAPDAYRGALDAAAASTADGRPITPQVPARPTGMLFGLQSSFHPFKIHPSFRAVEGRPLAEIVATLRDPQFRARLLAEEPQTRQPVALALATNWAQMYRLGAEPDYEPPAEASAAAVADEEGRRPEEVMLDWLLEDEGEAKVFAPLGSYVANDHEAIREMLEHPSSVVGAGDGGAHCGLICDASFPSYLLTHWARDRTRGPRIAVEDVVRKQTSATAAAYGLTDRGVIAPGMLADINVIDHQNMALHAPRMVNDLPAGGSRLVQDVDGYRFTIKSGEVTFADGESTGALPGGVLRAS